MQHGAQACSRSGHGLKNGVLGQHAGAPPSTTFSGLMYSCCIEKNVLQSWGESSVRTYLSNLEGE